MVWMGAHKKSKYEYFLEGHYPRTRRACFVAALPLSIPPPRVAKTPRAKARFASPKHEQTKPRSQRATIDFFPSLPPRATNFPRTMRLGRPARQLTIAPLVVGCLAGDSSSAASGCGLPVATRISSSCNSGSTLPRAVGYIVRGTNVAGRGTLHCRGQSSVRASGWGI